MQKDEQKNHASASEKDNSMDMDNTAAAQPSETPTPTADIPAGTTEEDAANASTPSLGETIAALQEAQAQTHERLLRTAADFENYKKRSRKEMADNVRRAEDRIVLDFLGILDNVERALVHADGEQGQLIEGIRMVQKQFLSVLERYEVKPFESVGQLFDPELHEAIQQTNSDLPISTVCQELQKGYRRAERLLRPAVVVVSLGPASNN